MFSIVHACALLLAVARVPSSSLNEDLDARESIAVEDELDEQIISLRTQSRSRSSAIAVGLMFGVSRYDELEQTHSTVWAAASLTVAFDAFLEPPDQPARTTRAIELERRERCSSLARPAMRPAVFEDAGREVLRARLARERSRALGCGGAAQ